MTIRPEEAPLDSDDELGDERPGRMMRRRLIWNGVLAALLLGSLWFFTGGGAGLFGP